MNEPDFEQRVEEIELALAALFDSPKTPAISSYDDGTRVFVQISWVVDSRGDTTLDVRCVVTVVFSDTQFKRYATLDMAHRKAFQTRLAIWVRQCFVERQDTPALQDDCALEVSIPDELFRAERDANH